MPNFDFERDFPEVARSQMTNIRLAAIVSAPEGALLFHADVLLYVLVDRTGE